MRAFFTACALVAIAAVAGSEAHEHCGVGGELRRNHHCVAVRHTKKDACCWMKQDGTHGKLPYNCCGTGWKSHKCEDIIDQICESHPDDLEALGLSFDN